MTILTMTWPILDPDMTLANLKAEALTDLRALCDELDLEPTTRPNWTLAHGADAALTGTIKVRPSRWLRETGNITEANMRAARTVHRCEHCSGWVVAPRWQRTPHNCPRVEEAA